jgi:hypothetical protein
MMKMPNRYMMKNYTTPLSSRKCKKKKNCKHRYPPIRMTKIRKTKDNKCWQRGRENDTIVNLVGR